jgi:hypothetical protein
METAMPQFLEVILMRSEFSDCRAFTLNTLVFFNEAFERQKSISPRPGLLGFLIQNLQMTGKNTRTTNLTRRILVALLQVSKGPIRLRKRPRLGDVELIATHHQSVCDALQKQPLDLPLIAISQNLTVMP